MLGRLRNCVCVCTYIHKTCRLVTGRLHRSVKGRTSIGRKGEVYWNRKAVSGAFKTIRAAGFTGKESVLRKKEEQLVS